MPGFATSDHHALARDSSIQAIAKGHSHILSVLQGQTSSRILIVDTMPTGVSGQEASIGLCQVAGCVVSV